MLMERRAAWLLLAGAVAATSVVALNRYDGHDFIYSVWAPIRGLLSGLNPYDPANTDYFRRYEVPVVAGLYTPAALLLYAPLALLSRSRAAEAITIINAALIWLGVLLLIPPRTVRGCLLAGVVGALVIASAPAAHTIELGQLSAMAFAGLALFVASLRSGAGAMWLPSIGIVLVALKPQSGIPVLVALAVLGYWQVLARAAAVLVITSVPGALLFMTAAGNPSAVLATVSNNTNVLSRLPPNDLADPRNLRIDALGLVSHLNGLDLTGLVWAGFVLVAATIAFVLALRVYNHGCARPRMDPSVATLLAVYVVISLYHLTYDQLLLYVGPLAALTAVTQDGSPSRCSRFLAGGAFALVGTGVAFRPGFRARIIDLGISDLIVHKAWVIMPTLIGILLVCGVIALRERASYSHASLDLADRIA